MRFFTLHGARCASAMGEGVVPRGRETKEWEGGDGVFFDYCFRSAVLKER